MKIATWVSNTYKTPPPPEVIRAPQVIAAQIVDGLVQKGHRVTLFAAEGSQTKAKLETAGLSPLSKKTSFDFSLRTQTEFAIAYEMTLASKMIKLAKERNFDIVHAHSTLRVIHFSSLIDIPFVYTLHIPLDLHPKDVGAEERVFYERFVLDYYKNTTNNYFIAISESQKKTFPGLNWAGVIHHGIDLKTFNFSDQQGEYLAVAGRIIPEKGFDIAIEISRRLGIPLIIAGSHSQEYPKYWQEKIKPYVDGKNIRFAEMLSGRHYVDFLSKAKAFLMPIKWTEPFGLVMVEAMACGTPVVAFNRGSVPEIIKEGETGFIIKPGDINGMAKAVKKIHLMPRSQYQAMRRACRRHIEKNFTIEKMVDGYEKVYQKILS